MIEIYQPWLFRVERYDMGENIILYSFYAEHSINMRVASKNAICSIFCKMDDKFDRVLRELQSRIRDCRLMMKLPEDELSNIEEVFDELQDYVHESFDATMRLIRVKDFEEFPEREHAINSLINSGSEDPRHELGDVQFRAEISKDMKVHPMTLIGAISIRGIITQIQKCAQYTLYAGKLAILSDTDTIKKRDESITKIVYVVGDIYDELQINEYRIESDEGYRTRHIFNRDEADSLMIIEYGPVNNLDDAMQELFQVNGSVNLFPLGGLPKGVWRKNNELMTRL